MLKFWSHRYVLHPRSEIGAVASAEDRPGSLLMIEWPNKKIGYADLFPWPEFGDAPLDEHLAGLLKGRITPLMEQSIWLAHRDAVKRVEKVNVFSGLTRVRNHLLIPDIKRIEDVTIAEAKLAGFVSVKAKVGRDPENELRWIDRFLRQHPTMWLRLDFNSSMVLPEFSEFMKSIASTLRPRIEFVEDPIPYDPDRWHEASKLVTLALDHESERVDWEEMQDPPPFKVLILKPARQDMKKAMDRLNKYRLKLVISSSLDHPVGIAHAAWFAGETKKFSPNILLDCGCLSQRSYKSDDYSLMLLQKGPYLNAINGTGIGFDSLFEKAVWTPITLQK